MGHKILLLCLFFNISAFAENFDNFNKRFEVVRKSSGEIHYIKAKGVISSFQFMPYIEGLRQELIDLKKFLTKKQTLSLMGQGISPEDYIDNFLDEIEIDSADANALMASNYVYDPQALSELRRHYLKQSYMNLPNINVSLAFQKFLKTGVLDKFKSLLQKFYLQSKMHIIANPSDPKFFYNQKITTKVLEETIKFLRKRVISHPVIDLAHFVFTDLLTRIAEQRQIAQNIFLYYAINYEDKLEFKGKELDKIVSSIYESKIPLTGYYESRKAAQTWLTYGWSKYDAVNRLGVNRMKAMAPYYASNSKLYYSFFNVVTREGSKKYLVNTALSNHMFTGKPAIVVDYDRPNRIRNLRTLVKIGQAALGFVPMVPSFIKSSVNNFAYSWYREQRKFEAFVYAYFEAREDKQMQKTIGMQLGNPFFML